MLHKKMDSGDDVKRFYKHNLLGMFITTEIWYVILYLFILFFKPTNTVLETNGIAGALSGLIKTMLFVDQTTTGSMWYMPMILCIYTTLPVVIAAKDKLSTKAMYLPLTVVFLISMVLPFINIILEFNGQSQMASELSTSNLCSMYYLYIFAGYAVSCGVLSKMRDWAVAALSLITFGFCCAFQLYAYAQPMNYLVSYNFPIILMCSVFTFELIRRKADLFNNIQSVITYLAKRCFGIYFVHIVIMELLNWYMSFEGWYRPVKLVFLEAVSLCGSILIIILLSQIKVCRKYLFMIKDTAI